MEDGTAVKAVAELQAAINPKVSIGVHEFILSGFKEVMPDRPACVSLPDLTGIMRFVNAYKGGDPIHVVVKGPLHVVVVARDEERNTEYSIAECKYSIDEFDYDSYMEMDAFRINLLTKFEDSGDRAALIKYISQLTDTAEAAYKDDGITIRTTITTGVKSGDNKVELDSFSSELSLTPRRTFPEVVQPETKLLLRVKSSKQIGLFDFSDGTWTVEACDSIRSLLGTNIGDIPII